MHDIESLYEIMTEMMILCIVWMPRRAGELGICAGLSSCRMHRKARTKTSKFVAEKSWLPEVHRMREDVEASKRQARLAVREAAVSAATRKNGLSLTSNLSARE